MGDKTTRGVACFLIQSAVLILVVWFAAVMHRQEVEKWQKDAIKRGYAEYNSHTGNWQWKELKPESEAKDAN